MVNEDVKPAGPSPMAGRGGCNRRSTVQDTGASPALRLLRQAVSEAVLADDGAPVVIADYGSSAGRNFLAPMAAALAALVLRRD